MLAPLEDTSDNALRSLCYKYGADLTFTEMTRFDSLARGNKSTWEKISILDDTPAYIQIVGSKENSLKKFLGKFTPEKKFQGFNLNLGCPSPDLIKHGIGCAMVKRIMKTRKLVQIIKDHGYKCSIKMRLGINRVEKEKKIYLNLIDGVDAEFFVVHARYGAQTYEEPADLSVYEECVKFGKNIIANGDIKSKDQVEFLKSVGVKGVMIGRNAVYDPAIFNKLKGLPAPSIEQLKEEYLELAAKFNSKYKYQKNVLKRIGKNENTDKTKAELSKLTSG